MFNKLSKFWSRNKEVVDHTGTDIDTDESIQADDIQFCINYVLAKDEQIYIDISVSDIEYSVEELAQLLNYVSSLKGQLDTIEVLKEGMESKDHDSFLGHFLALKNIEAEKVSSQMADDSTEGSSQPCVSPLDMI